MSHIGVPQSRTDKTYIIQNSFPKIGPIQVGSIQISTDQIASNEAGSSQINTPQIFSTEINAIQTNLWEKPLSLGIKLQQFFGSHNYDRQNTINPILAYFFQGETPFNLDLVIEDLPTDHLAEAEITGFDSKGLPTAGLLTLDLDANGQGWFLDPTPWDNSEFGIHNSETSFQAHVGSEAYDRYDLLTTIIHELAHLNGFIHGNPAFDQ